jgi:hypothetical protein
MIGRTALLTTLATVGLTMAGLAESQAQSNRPRAQSTRTRAGTYLGAVKCTGSDRFSNGSPTRRYRSRPTASVIFGSHRHLKRWTYFFLGHQNTVIQSRAVRRGASFTYAAGAHIERPGETRVTVLGVVRAARQSSYSRAWIGQAPRPTTSARASTTSPSRAWGQGRSATTPSRS